MSKALFSLFIIIFCSASSYARVWKDKHEWSMDWEHKYSLWVQSEGLDPKLFISPKSPYYGIEADCADALYIIRAIFSKENHLPFAVIDPSRREGGKKRSSYKLISNQINQFDYIKDENKRFVHFANFLAASLGSENLRYYDTYPIKLSEIHPGDIFHFMRPNPEKTIRHTLMIKKIHGTGSFDTLYSTQEIKTNNIDYFKHQGVIHPRPLMFREKQTLHHKPIEASGGFRRFIWPRYLMKEFKDFPASFHYSEEQFDLAEKLSSRQFFNHVRSLLQVREETIEEFIDRSLGNICKKIRERAMSVRQAVGYIFDKNGACMNYQEFDTYSTPMRDEEIKRSFMDFRNNLQEKFKSNKKKIKKYWVDLAFSIIKGESNHASKKFCEVSISNHRKVDIAHFKKRLFDGRISSDPNQPWSVRWGLANPMERDCKVFYQ